MTVPIRHAILDRDGVLNREAPDGGWIFRPGDWRWEDGALEGLHSLRAAGIRVSVATNQSGIGRGVFDHDAVKAVHAIMLREAAAAGGRIDRVLYCPHAPEDGCECRKPAPGLFTEAMAATGIPPSETVVVGDADRDLEAARRAGVRAVLVRTGKGRATETCLGDGHIPVYDDLRSAAVAIVAGDD
jgi:D-glycero-D-manno-heptose 1,7-bisphosphate phosphatase